MVTRGYPPYFDIERINKNVEDAVACHQFIGIKKTFFLDFPAVQLESVNRFDLNGKVLDVVKEVMPDEVYIPHYGDMQKDHSVVADACMVALRPKYKPQVKGSWDMRRCRKRIGILPTCRMHLYRMFLKI